MYPPDTNTHQVFYLLLCNNYGLAHTLNFSKALKRENITISKMEPVLLVILFIYLIIASISDIKRLEVPDWLNYSLALIGLSYNLAISILISSFTPIIESVVGLITCYLLSSLLYYSGQWGGGDAKFFTGIGALLGVPIISTFPFINLLGYSYHGFSILPFIIFAMIAGGIFGLLYIAIKAFQKRKEFLKEYNIQSRKISRYKLILLIIFLLLMFSSLLIKESYLRISIIILAIFPYLSMLLYTFIKSAEKSAMTKDIEVKFLTEGDWITDDITINGNVICKKKKIGLELGDLKKLKELYSKGLIKKVRIKNGFPFIPSFLIGFTIYIILDYLMILNKLLESLLILIV